MRTRRHHLVASAAVLTLCAVFFAACATVRPPKQPSRGERGLEFSHSVHMNAKMECADCHDFAARKPLTLNHELCSVCHVAAAPLVPQVPAPAAAPNTPEHQGANAQNCAMCHKSADFAVKDVKPRFNDEVIWKHDPHINKQVACTECHGDPDTKPLPDHMLMPDCMKCHATVNPKLNECSTCHKELREDVVPKFHGTRRIQHDAPAIWEKVHGNESMQDAQYCAICHKDEGFCADCHRVKRPESHTITWERKTHGLEASWDRQKCAVCHDEDSCKRCHENTKPQSHMGGWEAPLNTHCVSCHFPRGDTSCAVCHDNMDHDSAGPSIHKLGIYPPNCASCHPGGVPTRAPHMLNSTVECRVCHK